MYGSYYDYYSNPYSGYSAHSYGNSSSLATAGLVVGGFMLVFWIISLVLLALYLVGLWKVFVKANHAGWESLVGGHNFLVQLEISGIKGYWFFLLLIPIANIVVTFWKNIELAKSFGKSAGFGVLMSFFPYICVPILGLGNSQYIGPAYHETTPSAPSNNTTTNQQ